MLTNPQGVIVFDQTAFYAGERVVRLATSILAGETARFQVGDTQISGDQFLHIGGLLEGTIRAGHTACRGGYHDA